MTLSTQIARVLIVDDHPVVRRGLAELISDEPDLEVCGKHPIRPMPRQVETRHPDVVVVDISLQSGNGIELINRSRNATSGSRPSSLRCDESLFAERALGQGSMVTSTSRSPPRRSSTRYARSSAAKYT